MKRPVSFKLRVGFSAVCLWTFGGHLICAQERAEAGNTIYSAGPLLHLSVSKMVFRSGEVIPLDLRFTSETSDRYQINMATYDRSGRMRYEQFLVDPKEGTTDPLQLYFNSAWGFLGGGLTGFKLLSTTEISIHLDLNEWVRFDQPGTYQLTVVSQRVSDAGAVDYPRNAGRELKSNPVELRIIAADGGWQQLQFERIVDTLNQSGSSSENVKTDSREAALKALRYLGSEEAARELARRLRGEDSHTDWDCMFGLIGSPHRDTGLKEMGKLLEDADFPVSDLFLITMSILPLNPKEPEESLRKQRDENLKALRQNLISALPKKRGRALAVSLDTAMLGMDPKMPPELKGKLVSQLIETFPTLPVEKQTAWLQNRWQEVAGPQWLPVLRPLALHYEDFPLLRLMPAYESLQLSAAALKRWYELDPENARNAVIAEITRPKPRYNATVLGLLPDQTLPDVEHVIAEHLLAADNYEIEGNLASLLFRYADRAVLQEVLGKIDRLVGKWACDPQDHALAYVLKMDPGTAKTLIERAIAARGADNSACRHFLLTDIGALQNSPLLEELAIESLSDTDPEVANNAANFLGRFGSAAAEHVLWNRYEAWSREWNGRAEELRYVPTGKNLHVWDANLGQSLARALATGTNWVCDETKLRRIQALGVGSNIQGDVEQALRAWSRRPLTIIYVATIPPVFDVAQYNALSLDLLKKKLTQFPSGTKFALSPSRPSPSPEELTVRGDIFRFAEKNRITVICAP